MTVNEKPYTHVEVTHEWGRLEEVIVGIQPHDRFIITDFGGGYEYMEKPYSTMCRDHCGKQLLEVDPELAIAFERQADGLAALMEARGVRVRRLQYPEGADNHVGLGTGEGPLVYARDPIAVIGNHVIELAASEGWRERERFAVRPVIAEFVENSNAKWVAMPPPAPNLPADAPRLEGGDILVNGSEIYVGCGGFLSTNAGIRWLQQYLGESYTVYEVPLSVEWMHLDGALSLLRDGLALRSTNYLLEPLPGALASFEFIDVTPDEAGQLGCNVLILDENTVVMDTRTGDRIASEVQKRGIEVIHHDYDAVHAMGGGMRCSHHPIRRVVT
jgi:N-dimethylarginine dimethylaminohydrolase